MSQMIWVARKSRFLVISYLAAVFISLPNPLRAEDDFVLLQSDSWPIVAQDRKSGFIVKIGTRSPHAAPKFFGSPKKTENGMRWPTISSADAIYSEALAGHFIPAEIVRLGHQDVVSMNPLEIVYDGEWVIGIRRFTVGASYGTRAVLLSEPNVARFEAGVELLDAIGRSFGPFRFRDMENANVFYTDQTTVAIDAITVGADGRSITTFDELRASVVEANLEDDKKRVLFDRINEAERNHVDLGIFPPEKERLVRLARHLAVEAQPDGWNHLKDIAVGLGLVVEEVNPHDVETAKKDLRYFDLASLPGDTATPIVVINPRIHVWKILWPKGVRGRLRILKALSQVMLLGEAVGNAGERYNQAEGIKSHLFNEPTPGFLAYWKTLSEIAERDAATVSDAITGESVIRGIEDRMAEAAERSPYYKFVLAYEHDRKRRLLKLDSVEAASVDDLVDLFLSLHSTDEKNSRKIIDLLRVARGDAQFEAIQRSFNIETHALLKLRLVFLLGEALLHRPAETHDMIDLRVTNFLAEISAREHEPLPIVMKTFEYLLDRAVPMNLMNGAHWEAIARTAIHTRHWDPLYREAAFEFARAAGAIEGIHHSSTPFHRLLRLDDLKDKPKDRAARPAPRRRGVKPK